MKKYFSVAVISAFMFSASANSAEFLSCYGCESAVSFESAAENLALSRVSPNTSIYVFNMARGEIKSYDVYVEREPNWEFATSIEKTVDGNTKQKFENLSNAYSAVAAETRKEVTIPENIASSAYQLVNASFRVNNVVDYYNSHQSFMTKTANYVAAAFALTGKLVNINLTVTVYFSDGSKAQFILEGIGPNGELELKLSSARDVDNNDIPLTKEGYEKGGQYSFEKGGQNAIQEFLDAAARMGVPITFGGSGRFTQTMECDSEGKCTIILSPR